jgi:phosphotransferase system enzyme I (PtsI)
MPLWPSSQRKRRSRVVSDYVKLEGVGASEGVAVGPAFVHVPHEPKPERQTIPEEAVEEELTLFGDAVEAVVRHLSETAERLREGGSEKEAGIFDAHAEMAEDPEFRSEVEERVRNLESPEAAVLAVGEEYAGMFAAMEDEYLSARADDVRDVATQIATELMGHKSGGLETLEEPSVIVAPNLAPSDTARIPKGMALGFVISEGSRTSHVSIMARSFGIPAVVGVGGRSKTPWGPRSSRWMVPKATR